MFPWRVLIGKIKLDHCSLSGRRLRYRLSIDLPPASIMSNRNKTCWWHLNLLSFPWQEKLIAPLDATLKNVAKGTRIGKAKDETTLQSKIN